MMKTTYKKNILDLNYSRYLQNRTTAIVIITSYAVTLALTYMSQQITFTTQESVAAVLIVSGIVSIPCLVYIIRAQMQLKRIPRLIKALDNSFDHAKI